MSHLWTYADRIGGEQHLDGLLLELREAVVNRLDEAMGKCPHDSVSSEWDLCNACAADATVDALRALMTEPRAERPDSPPPTTGAGMTHDEYVLELATRITASERELERESQARWRDWDIQEAARLRAIASGLAMARDHMLAIAQGRTTEPAQS